MKNVVLIFPLVSLLIISYTRLYLFTLCFTQLLLLFLLIIAFLLFLIHQIAHKNIHMGDVHCD